MKKFTKTVSVLLFGLTLFSSTTAYAAFGVDDAALIAAIAGAVREIAKAYQALPDADYYIEYCVNGECKTSEHVGSCDIAKDMKNKALERGATEVTIYSVHSTVHGSCRNKTYKR